MSAARWIGPGGALARCALVLVLGAGPGLMAGEPADEQVLALLAGNHPRDRAITRGLEWLRARQRPDGAVGAVHTTALTALAVMAHLAAGHIPDDPGMDDRGHGRWMRSGIAHVLRGQDATGYFGGRDGSRMYGHGIATLMLAEALGQSRDDGFNERLRQALERAVAVTVAAAQVAKDPIHAGGWRYTPTDTRSDLSLSGWQVMSLHACQQVGIRVPDQVVADAMAYARRLIASDGRVGYEKPGEDRPALRGLAIACLSFATSSARMASTRGTAPSTFDPDATAEVLIDRIAARIIAEPIAWQGPWLFYRAYYDAVGMSRTAAEPWERYATRLDRVLIDHQNADGSWPMPPGDNEGGHGPAYATAMAVLALAVQRQLLPVYQR